MSRASGFFMPWKTAAVVWFVGKVQALEAKQEIDGVVANDNHDQIPSITDLRPGFIHLGRGKAVPRHRGKDIACSWGKTAANAERRSRARA